MKYCVDAVALLKAVRQLQRDYFNDNECKRLGIGYGYVSEGSIESLIKSMTVEADARPQGEWILERYKKKDAWGVTNCFSHTCSVCGANRKTTQRHFCPECGADMGDSSMDIIIGSMEVDGKYDEERVDKY